MVQDANKEQKVSLLEHAMCSGSISNFYSEHQICDLNTSNTYQEGSDPKMTLSQAVEQAGGDPELGKHFSGKKTILWLDRTDPTQSGYTSPFRTSSEIQQDLEQFFNDPEHPERSAVIADGGASLGELDPIDQQTLQRLLSEKTATDIYEAKGCDKTPCNWAAASGTANTKVVRQIVEQADLELWGDPTNVLDEILMPKLENDVHNGSEMDSSLALIIQQQALIAYPAYVPITDEEKAKLDEQNEVTFDEKTGEAIYPKDSHFDYTPNASTAVRVGTKPFTTFYGKPSATVSQEGSSTYTVSSASIGGAELDGEQDLDTPSRGEIIASNVGEGILLRFGGQRGVHRRRPETSGPLRRFLQHRPAGHDQREGRQDPGPFQNLQGSGLQGDGRDLRRTAG